MGYENFSKEIRKGSTRGGASLFNSTSIPPQTKSLLSFSIYLVPLGKNCHMKLTPPDKKSQLRDCTKHNIKYFTIFQLLVYCGIVFFKKAFKRIPRKRIKQ